MPRPPPTGWRISAHWMKQAMPAASCAITPAGATAFSAFGRNCTAGAFPGILGGCHGRAERSGGADHRILNQKMRDMKMIRKQPKRAADALLRRGFRWEIRAGLNRYGANIEEESL